MIKSKQWRNVEYTDDGCTVYQCCSCLKQWESRTAPGRGNVLKWNFCPYCGIKWEGELKITLVEFRFCNETHSVYALFPELPEPQAYGKGKKVTAYAHIGQHFIADYNYCMDTSREATEQEYSGLKIELEYLGYNLNVY